MPEEEYNFTLDENQIIFREILNVTTIGRQCHSVTAYDIGVKAWSANVDNYYHACYMLIPVCIRHLDKPFFDNLKRVLTKYKTKWVSYKNSENDDELRKEKSMRLTLGYADYILASIIKQLDRRGIYNEKSTHAVPGASQLTEDTSEL